MSEEIPPTTTLSGTLPECDLKGMGVLVTRAEHQAGPLCELITAQGGRPVPFPAIQIEGSLDPAPVYALLECLNDFHIAIFISPNAVQYGLAMLGERQLPSGLSVGAVGKGTARALEEAGIKVNIVPEDQFDSESLLTLPELNRVAGQRIIIFRGDGGRPLLGGTLRQRGAEVIYAEVYRRVRPEADVESLLQRWRSDVQVVTATSNDILDNLAAMLGEWGLAHLRETPLVVISERMRTQAGKLGCTKIILAEGADNVAVLTALCAWAASETRL